MVAVVGPPGAGKTTALQWLARTCLEPEEAEKLGLWAGTVPVFIRLADLPARSDLAGPLPSVLQTCFADPEQLAGFFENTVTTACWNAWAQAEEPEDFAGAYAPAHAELRRTLDDL